MGFLDTIEPAHITFEKGGRVQLHFGCVDAELDWREDPGSDRVDFTFEGFDEGDEVSGRGWPKMVGKQVVGSIAFHLGEESGFKAKKTR